MLFTKPEIPLPEMPRIPHSAMLPSTGISVLHTSFRVASKEDTACSTDAFGRTKRTKSPFGGTLVLVRCPTVPAPVLGLSDRFFRAALLFSMFFAETFKAGVFIFALRYSHLPAFSPTLSSFYSLK